MKKINILLLLLLALSCANAITGMLRFQDRELLIHPDEPGLGYPHKKEECEDRTGLGRIFGSKKCKMVNTVDVYDLNDKTVRMRLIDAGFSCTSKMRFKY